MHSGTVDWLVPGIDSTATGQEAVTTMSTAILLAVLVLSAIALNLLRGSVSARRSPIFLRSALIASMAMVTALYGVLKTGFIPITPINFTVIVLGIIYFGVIQCMRIHRQLDTLR